MHRAQALGKVVQRHALGRGQCVREVGPQRAQAQLVLVAPNVFEQHKELLALKAIAPDHQIVRWAGPGIENAWASARERQQAIQQAVGAAPSSSTDALERP